MSDLAQKLTAENKATKAKFLDLGICGLEADTGGSKNTICAEVVQCRLLNEMSGLVFRAVPVHWPDFGVADSQAAQTKHTVTRVEKTMGVVKAYLQLKAVNATKEMARVHAVWRMKGAKVPAGSLDSSHANTAANKRNKEEKKPNALKKSQ